MPKQSYNLDYLSRNIRYFRKLRKMKISDLATLIGMTEAHFGRIERALNVPSAAVVAQIADALNVSINQLFKRKGFSQNTLIHFRGRKFIPDELKEKAKSIISLYSKLEDICGASKFRSFPLDIPLKNYDKTDIENASKMVRDLLGIKNAIVFDLFNLLEKNGVRIVTLDLPDDVSGFSFSGKDNDSIIFFINSRKTIERSIYTIAHELGHLIFHMGSFKHNQYTQNIHDSGKLLEKTADYFAASFLMPESSILETVNQLGIDSYDWNFELLQRIKIRFSVSCEAFLHRLKELQLIKEGSYSIIFQQIRRFYEENNNTEPNPINTYTQHNSRLKDLLLIAKNRSSKRDDVKNIEDKLKELGVV